MSGRGLVGDVKVLKVAVLFVLALMAAFGVALLMHQLESEKQVEEKPAGVSLAAATINEYAN